MGATGTVPGVLALIGRTPLVPLRRLSAGLPVPVLVKCEHLNPGGSVKDRLAVAITLPPGLVTLAISASVRAGSSTKQRTVTASTRSKLASAKGSAVAEPARTSIWSPAARARVSAAFSLAGDVSSPTTEAPRLAASMA